MTTVLIVDDDPLILEGTKTYLETHGIETICAKNGEEAVSIMKQRAIDLAVVDIFMPKQGGFEVIMAMHEKLPIIAISGVTTNRFEPLSFAENLGARATMNKPFSPSDLLAAIESLLPSKVSQVGHAS